MAISQAHHQPDSPDPTMKRHEFLPRLAGAVLLTASLAACQASAPATTTTTPATTATSGPGADMNAMTATAGPAVQAENMIKAGEYLTIVGSCNDCHTQGWTETQGKVAPEDRFAGFNVGFRGSWGTVYGKNLRTITQRQSEDHWVHVLQTSDDGDGKPPMPWWNTAQMSERDMRAMYRYIKSLGPNTKGVPRNLKPGVEPTTPYVWVTPKMGS